MPNIHIAQSPLSNRIFAGILAKGGRTWARKTDVTGLACAAVAEHVLAKQQPIVVTVDGVPVYEITVRKLNGGN